MALELALLPGERTERETIRRRIGRGEGGPGGTATAARLIGGKVGRCGVCTRTDAGEGVSGLEASEMPGTRGTHGLCHEQV